MLFLDKAAALDLVVWNSRRVRLPEPFVLAAGLASLADDGDDVPVAQPEPATMLGWQSTLFSAETPNGRAMDARPLSLWR